MRELNKTFNVEVSVPHRDDPPGTPVYISGNQSDARKCKERILKMLARRTVETVNRTKGGVLATTAANAAAFPALPSEEETVIEINLSKAAHRNFIGTNHERKEELIRKLQGSKRVPGVEIRIPKKEDVSNVISVMSLPGTLRRAKQSFRLSSSDMT